MKKWMCVLFIFSSSFGWAQKNTRILFILDASNSMNVDWNNNQTRMEAAKEVLIQEVEKLRGIPNLEIALRVYGHQTPVTNTYQDCNDTKLEVPFGINTVDAIKSKVKSIQAKGSTPIARSLEAAAGDFPDTLARNYIILITDGLESCDNDPCIIARKLKDKGVKVTPFVIGLGMDLSYLDKFDCIGAYSDAESKESFRNVLASIVSKTLVNTTVQVNLNDITKKPLETNVTLFFYESGTSTLKYTFTHTLNRNNLPDTLVWLESHPSCFVEITFLTDESIDANTRKAILKAHDGIVNLIPQLRHTPGQAQDELRAEDLSRDMESLFRLFYTSEKGQEPNAQLVDLFKEVLSKTTAS